MEEILKYDEFNEGEELSNDVFSFKSNNNCFDLETKISLGYDIVTNLPKTVYKTLNLLSGISNLKDCYSLKELLDSIDEFSNNDLINNVNEIVVCFLFNSLNLTNILNKFLEGYHQPLIFDDILELKQELDDLENSINFEDLDFIENIDLTEIQYKLDYFNQVTLVYFIQDFSNYVENELLIYLDKHSNDYTASYINIKNLFQDLKIDDFSNFEDFVELMSATVKKNFLLLNVENVGIIGDSYKSFSIEEHVNGFINTYESVFSYLFKNFSLNIETLSITDFFNIDSSEAKNLRFLFYVMDSFKYDILILKKSIVVNVFVKSFFDNDDNLLFLNRNFDGKPIISSSLEIIDYRDYPIPGFEPLTGLLSCGGLCFTVEKSVTTYKTTILENNYLDIQDYINKNSSFYMIQDCFKSFIMFDYKTFLTDFVNDFKNVFGVEFLEFCGYSYDGEIVQAKAYKLSDSRIACDASCGLSYSNVNVLKYYKLNNSITDDKLSIFGIDNTILKEWIFNYFYDKFSLDDLQLLTINKDDTTFIDVVDDFIENISTDLSELINDVMGEF